MIIQFVLIFTYLCYCGRCDLSIDNEKLPFETTSSGSYDPTKDLDFCKVTCPQTGHGEEHVACKCHKGDDPECKFFMPEHQKEFRQDMLTWHNKLRNYVASGEEKWDKLGQAADMNALSYDLSLEYAAGCTSIKCKMQHDLCRTVKRFPSEFQGGQNIHWESRGPPTINKDVHMLANRSMMGWYNEYKNLEKTTIDKYDETAQYGHLTAMLWSTASYVGCTPTFKKNGVYTEYIVTCNYGTKDAKHYRINYIHAKVYQRGPPASKCPDGTKRNSIYPALCGEIEPIPLGDPVHKDSSDTYLQIKFYLIVILYLTNIFVF